MKILLVSKIAKEILSDANKLYHFTSFAGLTSILDQNTIKPSHDKSTPKDWKFGKSFVSVTSNPNYQKIEGTGVWGECRIQLNKKSIESSYEVVPFSYKDLSTARWKSVPEENEFRIITRGGLKNVKQYIEKVTIFVKEFRDWIYFKDDKGVLRQRPYKKDDIEKLLKKNKDFQQIPIEIK